MTEQKEIRDYSEPSRSRIYDNYDYYPKFKNVHINWLDTIPDHWEVRRIKTSTDIDPEVLSEDQDDDYLIEYIDISSVNSRGEIINEKELRFGDAPSRARKIVSEGDSIISTVRTYLKSIAYFDNPSDNQIVSTGFTVLRPRECLFPKFLTYWMQSEGFICSVMRHSKGVTYPAIATRDLGDISIVLPPKEEQKAIARFLDVETGTIDQLIQLKESLIELLDEKRTTLVTDAVTQGIDSGTKLKDSDVPGLGMVPKSWDLIPLKYSSQNITVGIVQKPSQYYVEKGVPALRSLNVKSNEIVKDDMVYISEEDNKELQSTQVHAGDLVSVRSGEPGTTAVIPEELDGVNCIDLIIIRNPSGYVPEFLSLLMNSEASTSQIEAGTEGAAQQHFNVEEVKELVFPKPKVKEQKEILEWLSPRLKEIDELEEKIREGIEHLEEYRRALITEAVTGQIDVRGEV